MRNRNRSTPSPHKGDKDKLHSRNNWALRKLVGKHGSHEAISSKFHASVFELKKRKRIARMIAIPSFEGWLFSENDKRYGIICPKGGSGKVKVCDIPQFRGEDVSLLPNDKRQSPEQLAKKLFALIKEGAKATKNDSTRRVILKSDDGKLSSSPTITMVVGKRPPKVWGSPLTEKTWRLAIVFVKLFRFHLGSTDTTKQEKITPYWGDSDVKILSR